MADVDPSADAVEQGRRRMDAAREATGNLTCQLTVTGWAQRGAGDAPVTWTGVWKSRG